MSIGEYVSPDGQLVFLVICPDGDWTLGFDGFPWHTHGSILAASSGQGEASAVERFVADVTGNVRVIALQKKNGRLADVWITEDPAADISGYQRYGIINETIEFRLWDGTAVKV